jgi:serine/threonine-protein kinase
MTPEKLGKYEIRGTLGRGAMGLVYDGWDPLIHRQVAIKTVRLAGADDEEATEGLARFRREAQAAGRLSHPNIVGVYDFGETDDVAYIVMEFVAGGSLKEVLDKREALDPGWVCTIMGQVLAALSFSHARGVVHRDVKPANVMLSGDGAVKLADFGIARIESSSMTSVGVIMGTPAYMAPEQFLGEPADSRSDIYAAGAMLFHLLTASRPYEGNPTAIMQKVLNAPAPPRASERLPGLPVALDAVLQRAMARHPQDRFQDAAAFSAAMNAALCAPPEPEEERTVILRPAVSPPTRAPAPAPPPAKPPALPKPRRNLAVPAGIVAALLLAGGAAAWFLTRSAAPPPKPPAQAAIQPQPATPQPPPPSPAKPAPNSAQLARAVQTALAAVPCTLATASASGPAGLSVTGLAGSNAAAQLRQQAAGAADGLDLDWQVATFNGPYCSGLDAVRAAAAGGGTVKIAMREGTTNLRDGLGLHTSISGLTFPAYLRVDYLSSDGKLFHLYPQIKDTIYSVRHDDPSVLLPAGQTLRLGEGQHWGFIVGLPFGTDMMLVVASSQQLLPGRRPNAEDKAAYLSALQKAIQQAAAQGAQLAAGGLLLQSIPK